MPTPAWGQAASSFELDRVMTENKDMEKEKSELRKFGLTVGIAFGILAGLLGWAGKGYYFWFFVIAAVLIIAGLVQPRLLKYIHKVWMTAALAMGWFMTRVILVVLFYLIVTPIGLLGRILGKDFLDLKFPEAARQSYWIAKEIKPLAKEQCEKQF